MNKHLAGAFLGFISTTIIIVVAYGCITLFQWALEILGATPTIVIVFMIIGTVFGAIVGVEQKL